jgi:hypothetical protein
MTESDAPDASSGHACGYRRAGMLHPMSRRWAQAARAVILALGSALLVACGASPTPQPPTGIDGLTIPTPSPTPTDFVGRVDNPWFPLEPGTRWTYDRYTPAGSRTITATVLPDPHPIGGVDTTAVRWELRRPGRVPSTLAVRWYAEDTAGNVWWFGQRVARRGPHVDLLATRSWTAGREGAQAGLLVSAAPRVGDGYLTGYQPHVVESRSTVVSIDATVALPTHDYRGTVATRDLSALEPTTQVESFYARGIGLVGQQTTVALSTDLSLVHVRRP